MGVYFCKSCNRKMTYGGHCLDCREKFFLEGRFVGLKMKKNEIIILDKVKTIKGVISYGYKMFLFNGLYRGLKDCISLIERKTNKEYIVSFGNYKLLEENDLEINSFFQRITIGDEKFIVNFSSYSDDIKTVYN